MESERSSAALPPTPVREESPMSLFGWKASFLMGALTLILGLIVAFRPSASLTVIAVLIGILAIFAGIFHFVDAVDAEGRARTYRVIAGILFILGGVILLRHLDLSLALIGLIVGASWIVSGAMGIIEGFSERGEGWRVWRIIFGIIGLIAGIVVISTPVTSITVLASFIGVVFAIMGVFQMADAVISRRAEREFAAAEEERVSVPGQRPTHEPATGRTEPVERSAMSDRPDTI